MDTDKLLPRASDFAEPRGTALDKKPLFMFLGGLCVAGAIAFGISLASRQKITTRLPIPENPQPFEVSNSTAPATVVKFPETYLNEDRTPKLPPPPPPPVPVPLPFQAPVAPQTAGLSPFAVPLVPHKEEPEKKEEVKAPVRSVAAHEKLVPPKSAEKPKLDAWLYVKLQPNPLEQHRAALTKEGGGHDDDHDASHNVIKRAQWARAVDPVHVLYRTQRIEGILQHAVNSDIPGDLFIVTTRPVYDALGQDEILIPQLSILIGTQQGTPKYGDARLNADIVEIQFPDKTIVSLAKAKLTDKSGAIGGEGSVNNHYAKLGMAVVFSTLLNIGAQSIGGNTTGYNPTVEQRAARELGQGVNQAGQGIVGRELKQGPTITLPAGSEVGVQFQENMSFTHAPRLIK